MFKNQYTHTLTHAQLARLFAAILWRKAKYILEQMSDCMIYLAQQSKAQKKPIIPHIVKLF